MLSELSCSTSLTSTLSVWIPIVSFQSDDVLINCNIIFGPLIQHLLCSKSSVDISHDASSARLLFVNIYFNCWGTGYVIILLYCSKVCYSIIPYFREISELMISWPLQFQNWGTLKLLRTSSSFGISANQLFQCFVSPPDMSSYHSLSRCNLSRSLFAVKA